MSGTDTPDPMAEVERLKAAMIKRSFFVMFRRVVAPERLQPVLLDHYRWIIALEKQGSVFASGPLFWQVNEGRLSVSVDFSDQTYRFE